ncbi:MAG: Crp/Fnr family transcriptional regulator [Fibrobacterota bacterium]
MPEIKTLKKGSFLFREKDKSNELYIIQSGKLLVSRKEGTKPITIGEFEKGAIVGEMSLIDGKPRSASVSAIEDSEVLVLTREEFSSKTSGIPPWFFSILKVVSYRIREADKRLKNNLKFQNECKAGALLLLLLKRYDKDGSGKLDLKDTQKTILKLTQMPRKELRNTLKGYSEKKYIKIGDNNIIVIDKKSLKQYVKYLRIENSGRLDRVKALSSTSASILESILEVYENSSEKEQKGDFASINACDMNAPLTELFGDDEDSIKAYFEQHQNENLLKITVNESPPPAEEKAGYIEFIYDKKIIFNVKLIEDIILKQKFS